MGKSNTFEIVKGVVVCHSSSGKNYELSENHCTCVGFGYHRNCSHLKEAKALGIFLKLKEQESKNFNFRNPYIIEQRKKAIQIFLTKNKIKFNQKMIDVLEPKVTSKMSAKTFLEMVKKQVIL